MKTARAPRLVTAALLMVLGMVSGAAAGEPVVLSDRWLDAVTAGAMDTQLLAEAPARRVPILVDTDPDPSGTVPATAAVPAGTPDFSGGGVRDEPDSGALPALAALVARPGSFQPAGTGGVATVTSVGLGDDASALTSAAAFQMQTLQTRRLGSDGFVALVAARATGARSANVVGAAESVLMAPLAARAAASGSGDGPGSAAALSVETQAALGSGVTLSGASVAVTAVGAGRVTARGEAAAAIPGSDGPAMALALDLRGSAEVGTTALAGQLLVIKGPTVGLVFSRYQGEACCGGGASVSVQSTKAPGGRPVMSATQTSNTSRDGARQVAGVSWTLTSFGNATWDFSRGR